MRKAIRLIATFLMFVAVGIFFMTESYAASSYDTALKPSDVLLLQDYAGNTKWVSDPLTLVDQACASDPGYSGYISDTTDSNFRAAVVEHIGFFGNRKISVAWSTNSSYTTDFASSSGNYEVRAPFDARIELNLGTGGSVICTISTYYSSGMLLGTTQTPDYTQTRIWMSSYPVTYPSGYAGPIVPSTRPVIKYVAMGDSFSSGEGNPPFEPGTDTDGIDECHRSSDAYPRILQADSSLSLGATAFVACSGATSSHIRSGGTSNGAWGEDPQVDSLSPDTDVVTITVGGNNIKFSEFANACVYGSCASSSSEYQESWDIMTDLTRTDYLPIQLESLFSDMSSELWLNSTVKVYVVGYPYLMTQDSWEDRGVGICSDFDEDEATAAEALVLKLDSVIHTAVTDFDDSRFVYVDPLATGSPFLNHELCRGDAYFRGTEAGLDDPAYVFHPNEDGQEAYAALIKSNMS